MVMSRSSNRLSRRGFGRLAVVAALGASAAAAAPQQVRRPESPAAAQPQPATADVIDGFDVPISTEPGFVYRP